MRDGSITVLIVVAWVVGGSFAGCGDSSPGTEPDAVVDPCADHCSDDETCVLLFDGMCMMSGPVCRTLDATCQRGWACSEECEDQTCGSPYQCSYQIPCGFPVEDVNSGINCYGP